MNLLERTKEICNSNDIRPSRSKGQNFLIDEATYDRIVDAAALTKEDVVLEVGPGLGFLTAKLAKAAGRVIAVELDDKLAELNRRRIEDEGSNNVELINSDILKLNLSDPNLRLPVADYKIVANLPYNITSFFLRTVFTSWPRPREVVLLLQREVVERICARPGEMSLLAISIQYYAEVENLFDVPRSFFWPSPEVDSAVIRIRTKKIVEDGDMEKRFFRLVKIGFSAKRKMLKNNLSGGLKVSADEVEAEMVSIGLSAKARPQDLSLDDWKKLASML